MADGPLQNLANLQVTVDANGSLVLYAKTGGTVGPARKFLNSKGRCETGNRLVVVFK